MAIYHCSVKVIGRNEGRSVIAAAAYRSGTQLISEYDGLTRDYRKKGWIEESEILLPENAPLEYMDRSKLWNAVERIEKTANAQLAREVEVSLPVELTREQQKEVLHRFVQENFVSVGMCADIAIHNPPQRNDKNQPIDADGKPTKDKSKMIFNNPHAHILLTVRPIDENGKWEDKSKVEYLCVKDGIEKALTAEEYKKASHEGWEKQFKYIDGKKKIWLPASIGEERKLKRVNRTPKTSKFGRKNPKVEYWNSQDRIPEWRKSWEVCVNDEFQKLKMDMHIDCRSYEDQGLDLLPTIHMGPAATNIERRADRLVREGKPESEVYRSDIGDINREIKEHNKFIIGAKKWLEDEIEKLKSAFKKESEVEDFIKAIEEQGYILRKPKTDYSKHFSSAELQQMQSPGQAKEFVIKYKIYTFKQMQAFQNRTKKDLANNEKQCLTCSDRIKRLKDLSSTYIKLQEVKTAHDECQSKTVVGKLIYAQTHKEELQEYEKVNAAFQGMLNGEKITPKKWNKEIAELQKKLDALSSQIEEQYKAVVYTEEIEETKARGGQITSMKDELARGRNAADEYNENRKRQQEREQEISRDENKKKKGAR